MFIDKVLKIHQRLKMPPKQTVRKTIPTAVKTEPAPTVVTNQAENKEQKPKKKFQVYPVIQFKNEEILNIDVKNIIMQKPEEDSTTYKNFWGTIYYKGADGKLNWLYIRLDGYFCFGIKRFNEDGQPSDTAPYSTGLALLDQKESKDVTKTELKKKIFKKLEEVEAEIRRQFLPFAKDVGKEWIDSMEYFDTPQGRKDCRLISYSKKDPKRLQPSLKAKLWIFVKNAKKMCGTQIFETGKKTKTGKPVSFSAKFTQYKNFATVSAVCHLKSLFISSSEKGYIAVQFQLMGIEFPEDYHRPFERPSVMHDGVVGNENDMEETENEANDALNSVGSDDVTSSKATAALTEGENGESTVDGDVQVQDQ